MILSNRKYTSEQISFISINIKGRSFNELTDMFNKQFGLNLKVSTMISLSARHDLHNGRNTRFNDWLAPAGVQYRFPKGHIPFNKGRKGITQGGVDTQFKKGHKPANWVPVGTERTSKDGYVEVKIADGKLNKNWKSKHIAVWEEANGPVPKGHVVIFGDGNKKNCELDNLILVSRAQLARLNQNNLIQDDVELTKTGIIIADLHTKISQRKKGQRSGRKREKREKGEKHDSKH
jgi:hypothetical protein